MAAGQAEYFYGAKTWKNDCVGHGCGKRVSWGCLYQGWLSVRQCWQQQCQTRTLPGDTWRPCQHRRSSFLTTDKCGVSSINAIVASEHYCHGLGSNLSVPITEWAAALLVRGENVELKDRLHEPLEQLMGDRTIFLGKNPRKLKPCNVLSTWKNYFWFVVERILIEN